MTTSEKVSELIIKLKKGKISQDALKPEARLREDLGLDSLAMAELLVITEDAFKVSISLEDARKAKTFADIITCVDKYCAV